MLDIGTVSFKSADFYPEKIALPFIRSKRARYIFNIEITLKTRIFKTDVKSLIYGIIRFFTIKLRYPVRKEK